MFAVPVVGHEPQSNARVCAPREAIVNGLELGWKETVIGLGINSEGALVEIFTNADRMTWTIIVTVPHGLSCVVTSGQDWKQVKSTPKSHDTAR